MFWKTVLNILILLGITAFIFSPVIETWEIIDMESFTAITLFAFWFRVLMEME